MSTKIIKKRNSVIFDNWSIVHLCSGIIVGWLMNPLFGVGLLILWEPVEIFLISPWLGQYNVTFGYETIRNSLSDIFFDLVGLLVGALLLTQLINPPLYLF